MNDTDKETLRKVYQDQMDHLRPQLQAALDTRTETELARMDAQRRHENAVYRHAALQGRVDALREIAARDNVSLSD